MLLRADIRQGPADLVAVLVQWLVMLIAIMTAVNTVGLSSVSDLLNQILLYVPKVIAAVVVLILGLFFASFLSGLIKAAAANVGLGEAEALASLARYAIVAFTAAVTLEELGIAPDLVRSAFVILFGAVALGLALAFGLGCQGKHKEVMMVDFWAEWCAPCRAIAPTLEELARESGGKVSLAKVNVDEHPSLAARYGVRSIPTILFMRDGTVVDQVIGAVPKAQLKKKLDAIA